MTVAAQTPIISYVENGTTTAFPVPFRYDSPADLRATRLLADGTTVELVNGVDFSATPGPTNSGGALTLVTAGPSGAKLTIFRRTARAQTADYIESGAFTAESHESALDKFMLVAQEIDEDLARAPKVLPGQMTFEIDPTGLQDGDLWQFSDGKMKRFDAAPFAGRFYAGAAVTGLPVPADGTGVDGGLRADLAGNDGADLIKIKDGVTLADLVAEWTSDLGAASLQAAVTAAAGKRLFITRNWDLTAPVNVPAAVEIIINPSVTIRQLTNNTPSFVMAGDNAVVTGGGLIRGTNTEASPDKGAIYITGASCSVKGMRIQNARIGIAVGAGATNYLISENLLWGGAADGNVASDIIVYGPIANRTRRGIITGNRCFGNNDTGISCNLLSGDAEFIISNNIVCPLNSTMTARLSNAATARRYGIVFNYNGGATSTRIVANNLVIGCAYAGLYGTSNTLPVGVLSFNGNVAQECGFGMSLYDGTDAGLRSGILLIGGGRVIGAGNAAVDCFTCGLKIVDNVGFSNSEASRIKLGVLVSGTVDPVITPSPARAVHLTGLPSGIDLDMFVLHGVGATQAGVILDATGTTCGDVILRGRVEVSSDRGALQIAAQVGGTDFVRPVIIDGMSVTGNSQTSGEFNSGLWYQGNVHVRNFTANTFHRGINNALNTTTRRLDLVHQNITLLNCTFGCNGSGTGLLLVEGLTCTNVTTKLFGCFVAGQRATDQLGGDTVRLSSNQSPATAFGALAWANGDMSFNSQPATTEPLCWINNGAAWIAGPAIP